MKIIINGRERKWNKDRISYAALVTLALYDLPVQSRACPSVGFCHADQDPSEGIFEKRTSVKIKEGTIFNCTVTSKA